MRLIDADSLIESLDKDGMMTTVGYAVAVGIVKSAPTIDAVPVVRCRECKNWETDWEPNYFNPDNPMYYCAETDLFLSGNWFCADGQRREDGDNGKHL